MPGYEATTYLLDRANIEDTVRKLFHYYDVVSETGLENDVYAAEVVIDYTSLMGGEPTTHKGPEWAAKAIGMVKDLSTTQHTVIGIISELPQPGADATRPDKIKTFAHVSATHVRKDARGGPLMQNGGRCEYELVRIPELEAKGVNPWRITLHRTILSWQKGNWAVFSQPKTFLSN